MKFPARAVLCALLANLSVGFACSGSDGEEPCPYKTYGHRRALLKKPVIQIPGASRDHNFEPYFKNLEANGLDLRQHLLNTDAFHNLKKMEKKGMDGAAVNVASLGFVFFDQEGTLINEQPFHFAPVTEQENIEKVSFFVRGL